MSSCDMRGPKRRGAAQRWGACSRASATCSPWSAPTRSRATPSTRRVPRERGRHLPCELDGADCAGLTRPRSAPGRAALVQHDERGPRRLPGAAVQDSPGGRRGVQRVPGARPRCVACCVPARVARLSMVHRASLRAARPRCSRRLRALPLTPARERCRTATAPSLRARAQSTRRTTRASPSPGCRPTAPRCLLSAARRRWTTGSLASSSGALAAGGSGPPLLQSRRSMVARLVE